jgi:protein arginine kinase
VKLADLPRRLAGWLSGGGAQADVVVSSRARLARNLAGMPFLSRCTAAQAQEIAQAVSQAALACDLPEGGMYLDLQGLEALDRQLLMERRLISRPHADASGPRGVVVSGAETVSVMVNEEDHLRIQSLAAGMQLTECYQQVRALDDQLEKHLTFAFSSRFGYLTACPTNVGTGLRVSVMLHLPALKITGEIEKALRAARDLSLAVRGMYGEGTEAIGDLFQVSNQVTLGRSEEQIIEEFSGQILPSIIEYERRARDALLKTRRVALEDRIFRALAVLRSARLLSSEETMYLLSHARLGLSLKLVEDVAAETINQLMLITQPAHLQRLLGQEMAPPDRGAARAAMVRQKLGAEK